MNFSVLMSLYIKEKPQYFIECMNSLLNQTVLPNEFVIVKDGPLTVEMEAVLTTFIDKYPNLIKIVTLKENSGLGVALAKGLVKCSYDIVARMDTDDIAVPDRFEIQLKEFENNPNLDICGSSILEFVGTISNIVSSRQVPLEDAQIKRYQKKRDSFNHMTVMFRKKKVLEAGNYQSCPLMEDTLLWVHMMQKQAYCMNIAEPLVYARVTTDLYERRGGFSYFKKYRVGRKKILDTGYITYIDYLETIVIQFVVCLIPNCVRSIIFQKILHAN